MCSKIKDISSNRFDTKIGEWQSGKGESTEEKGNKKTPYGCFDDENYYLNVILAGAYPTVAKTSGIVS